jgi:DNA-directed RNA polymerase omega subunit
MRNGIAVVGDEVPELRARVYEVAASLRISGLRADDHRFSIQKPVALVGKGRCDFQLEIIIEEPGHLMSLINGTPGHDFKVVNDDEWPGIDSKFRLIVVAALRSKQLLNGSLPRIDADPSRRRNTSIALEEVKQGLVHFTSDDGN